MFKRTLRQHALAAALALSAAAAAGWAAVHLLALKTEAVPAAAPGLYIPNLGNTLDEQTRMRMGAEVLRIWDATHKTIIFVTHNLTEAVFLSDQVVVLGTRPATVLDRVQVDLPRPRTYDAMATETFGRLRDRIWRQIVDLGVEETPTS